jgi:dipeptidyl aminopeptidase/acylaminoacyl peptidase
MGGSYGGHMTLVGVPRWYLVGKDEGHGFAKRRNLDFQFYTTVQFIQSYLLN